MKLINVAQNKLYHKSKIQQWAKDMLDGLKQELIILEKTAEKAKENDNLSAWAEAKYQVDYVRWFIANHFEE